MAFPALPRSNQPPDVLIVGGGIIGLALGLELHARGAQVCVIERDTCLSHASVAAAGMLAAQDPHNPAALASLAELSISLYPTFLGRIEQIAGQHVPFQTETTVQYATDGTSTRIAEHSLDPRQLASALLAAIQASGILLHEHATVTRVTEAVEHVTAITSEGQIQAKQIVYATGAWPQAGIPVTPRKGQMLRVQVPTHLNLREVHRNEHIYIVPRTTGPQQGTALIGATVEDVGFDTLTHAADLDALRQRAAEMLPAFMSKQDAPTVEAWAGLRPATPDALPILGACNAGASPAPRQFAATGHYRNGILLAPATATVLADVLGGTPTSIDMSPFSPARFAS